MGELTNEKLRDAEEKEFWKNIFASSLTGAALHIGNAEEVVLNAEDVANAALDVFRKRCMTGDELLNELVEQVGGGIEDRTRTQGDTGGVE